MDFFLLGDKGDPGAFLINNYQMIELDSKDIFYFYCSLDKKNDCVFLKIINLPYFSLFLFLNLPY